MKYEPLRHQQIADRFLAEHDRGALLLGMGLGKSAITLTRLEDYLYNSFRLHKVLVIAPLKVAEDTWTREADKWDHLRDLRVSRVLGTAKQRRKALCQDADVYVINWENVSWLVAELGRNWPFDGLVLDELSGFKSSRAKRWRMLKRVAPLCKVVWGLTGTPAAGGYIDLYAEMYLIDNGAHLGKTLTGYRDRYFRPGARKGHVVFEWTLKPGAKELIDQQLAQFCLSMKTEDWVELPDCIVCDHFVHMTASERKLYDAFQREKILPLLNGQVIDEVEYADHAVVGSTAATISGKLLQMANGAVYDEARNVVPIHDQKLQMLLELVEQAQSEPVLVYYAYQHDRERIRAVLPQARDLETAEDVAAWNRGEVPVLLAHPASVAYGLNLQEGGHILIWFGLTWSLEQYQQANARLHRLGQGKPVFIHHILCEGTLDEKVVKALQEKDAVQESLLQALKSWYLDTTT